jgi:3-hydroxyisobutyrate dehydrogenase-like beta-hydroxyacid dehydrogenase
MQITNVGIVSPGDMGQAIAIRLRECGLNVYTTLEGRSARTRELARQAGIGDCGSMGNLVATCDTLISVLNPAAALDKAREAAAAIGKAGRRVVYADWNAIAPQTAEEIDRTIRAAGGHFVDGGIIGPPPRGENDRPRIYVSGAEAHLFAKLEHPNLKIRVLSERIGHASGLKMCYGAMTKGSTALAVELLVAARRLGVEQALENELKTSLRDLYEWQQKTIAVMPPKAYRWVPEMLEIARTFEGTGQTPRLMQGAADMYEMIAATPVGQESPEQARKAGRSGLGVIESLAADKR